MIRRAESPRRAGRASRGEEKGKAALPRALTKENAAFCNRHQVLGARLTVGHPPVQVRKCRSESDAPNFKSSGPTPPARGADPDQKPRD